MLDEAPNNKRPVYPIVRRALCDSCGTHMGFLVVGMVGLQMSFMSNDAPKLPDWIGAVVVVTGEVVHHFVVTQNFLVLIVVD